MAPLASTVDAQNAEFTKAVREFMARAQAGAEEVARKVALDMLSAIVQRTPVDTGRARANWNLDVQRWNGSTSEETDPGGRAALERGAQALGRFQIGEVIYIVNGLVYAPVLEYGLYPGNGEKTVGGYSKQAPQGMVRLTMAEYQDYVKEALRKLDERSNGSQGA